MNTTTRKQILRLASFYMKHDEWDRRHAMKFAWADYKRGRLREAIRKYMLKDPDYLDYMEGLRSEHAYAARKAY